jgi:hypothetical protein
MSGKHAACGLAKARCTARDNGREVCIDVHGNLLLTFLPI